MCDNECDSTEETIWDHNLILFGLVDMSDATFSTLQQKHSDSVTTADVPLQVIPILEERKLLEPFVPSQWFCWRCWWFEATAPYQPFCWPSSPLCTSFVKIVLDYKGKTLLPVQPFFLNNLIKSTCNSPGILQLPKEVIQLGTSQCMTWELGIGKLH